MQFGDLLASSAEALVSSDDHMLSMGGGISRAIVERAGSSVVIDAAKAVPCDLGDVVVTGAGALPSRYVFHVVTIGPEGQVGDRDQATELIRTSVERCLEIAEALRAGSIAFPALGAGAARLPPDAVARALVGTVIDRLRRTSSDLVVEVYLQPKRWQTDRDYDVFFEELAAATAAPDVRTTTVANLPPTGPTTDPVPHDATRDRLLALESERVDAERRLASPESVRGSPMDDRPAAERHLRATREMHDLVAERRPTRLFVSYASADVELAAQLMQHMAGLRLEGIATWSDQEILPGATWESEISEALAEADVALVLISPSFLASDYCTGVEWEFALQRRITGDLTVIPIILRPSDWHPLVGDIQVLPPTGAPVSTAPDRDQAFVDVITQLRGLIAQRRSVTEEAGPES